MIKQVRFLQGFIDRHARLSPVDDLKVLDTDRVVTALKSVVSEFITGQGDPIIIEIKIAALRPLQSIPNSFVDPVALKTQISSNVPFQNLFSVSRDQCSQLSGSNAPNQNPAKIHIFDNRFSGELQTVINWLCRLNDVYQAIMIDVLPDDLTSKTRPGRWIPVPPGSTKGRCCRPEHGSGGCIHPGSDFWPLRSLPLNDR